MADKPSLPRFEGHSCDMASPPAFDPLPNASEEVHHLSVGYNTVPPGTELTKDESHAMNNTSNELMPSEPADNASPADTPNNLDAHATASQLLETAKRTLIEWLDKFTPDELSEFSSFVNLQLSNRLLSDSAKSLKSRPRSLSAMRAPSEKKRKRKRDEGDNAEDRISKKSKVGRYLFSPDSDLLCVDLRDIVNFETFTTALTDEEKDRLLAYLPAPDRTSPEAIEQSLNNNFYLTSCFETLQELISSDSVQSVVDFPPQKKRRTESWKEKHFEEYYGQKALLASEREGPTEAPPTFSFVEYARLNGHSYISPSVAAAAAANGGELSPRTAEARRPLKLAFKRVADERRASAMSDLSGDDDGDAEFAGPKRPRERKRKSTGEGGEARRTTKSNGAKTSGYRMGALQLLQREKRPLSAKEMVELGQRDGLFKTSGKTPWNTIASIIYVEIQAKGSACPFVKVRPGVFGLREWGGQASDGDISEANDSHVDDDATETERAPSEPVVVIEDIPMTS